MINQATKGQVGNVVNLFEWIKKDPERLAHEIYYTPYARQV